MVIKKNLTAENGVRMHGIVTDEHDSSAEKLVTGFRINRAEDDLAYFHISERMRSQLRGLMVADRNCQDGISMIQTASSTFAEVHEVLQRGRELSVRAANGALSDDDRATMNIEVDELKDQLKDMNDVTFNQISLFAEAGSIQTSEDTKHNSLVFQVGPLAGQFINVHLFGMAAEDMGLGETNVKTMESAGNAIQEFDDAINYVSVKRSYYGAIEGRLNHALEEISSRSSNITDAEAKMRDTDYEKTMVRYATTDILMQSGIAVIAQSNKVNATGVSSLLGWLK